MQAALRPAQPSRALQQGRKASGMRPIARVRRVCSIAAPEAPPARRAQQAQAPAPPRRVVKAPVIDGQRFLAPERQGLPPPSEVARQIHEAGQEFGCFQLANHGLSLDLIAAMKREQRAFFALPLEEKLRVKRTEDNPNGFCNDELTKRARDLKEIFDFASQAAVANPGLAVLAAPNQWPGGRAAFRATMEAYFSEMARASFKLLEAFSLALDLPLNSMHHLFEDNHTSFMRLNYYPATPPSEHRMALNHHTDAGFLTILSQDPEVHGLQFHKRGQWNDVTPEPDALTINVGDQCQVLTNDVFKAPTHRVVSPHNGKARHSAPFFFNPRPDAVIEPLPAYVTPERPPVYNAIPWAQFRSLRYAGDRSDRGEEVQIYHYKR